MSGIFASQFNQVSPYDPVGLDTGTPSVGMTLGKKTPRRPPEEKPARVPSNTGTATGEAASAAATGDHFASASGSNSAVASNQMSLSQAGAASHMSAANQAANGIGYHPDAAPATHIVMPKHSGADATPPKQNSNSGGGFWGWASHELGNVTHNPVVNGIMHFGDPFGSRDSGLSGAVADQSQTNPTIKPTRVYNPQRPSAGEISQGGPRTIPGQVEGNPAVDVQAPNALPRSTAYDNLYRGNLGRQFMGKSAPADTLSGAASSGGESFLEQIPNDLSELFSSVL